MSSTGDSIEEATTTILKRHHVNLEFENPLNFTRLSSLKDWCVLNEDCTRHGPTVTHKADWNTTIPLRWALRRVRTYWQKHKIQHKISIIKRRSPVFLHTKTIVPKPKDDCATVPPDQWQIKTHDERKQLCYYPSTVVVLSRVHPTSPWIIHMLSQYDIHVRARKILANAICSKAHDSM